MGKELKWLRYMRCIAIPTMIISLACIGIGIASIVQSQPYFIFPFCLGGAMIAGIASLLSAYWDIKLYNMYVATGGTADETCWKYQMVFVGTFMMLSLIIGLGISGIWGMVDAQHYIDAAGLWPSEKSRKKAEYGEKNLGYAIATFILVLILCGLKCAAFCVCQCYFDDEFGGAHFYTGNYVSTRAVRDQTISRSAVPVATRDTTPYSAYCFRDSRDDISDTRTNTRTNFNHPLRDTRINIDTTSEPEPSAPTITIDSPSTDGQPDTGRVAPPHYDEICEPPPPSYEDVLENSIQYQTATRV